MAWPQTGQVKVNLNLRSGAGTSNPVLAVIPSQSQVTVTGPEVNGWYPVTYAGQTGWAKMDYFNPLTPQTAAEGTQGPPPSSQGSSPFYDPQSAYGAQKNMYDTPLVRDDAAFTDERTRWVTESGFGGIGKRAGAVESLFPKLGDGYGAAKMNNPGLLARDYFKGLGSNFLDNALRRMTPSQRGENLGVKNPLVRSTPR